MRPIVLLASFLLLLAPFSPLTNTSQNASMSTGLAAPTPSAAPTTSGTVSTSPPIGQFIILRSIFGVAFYNSSGKITIQPASLFMNMTVNGSNSTGVSFTINSGPSPINKPVSYVTIGPSSTLTVQRLFTVLSGQAFLAYSGRLTIQAGMTEVYPCQQQQPSCLLPNVLYQLFLTGPSRMASVTTTNDWSLFTSLFGFLYNSQTKIGLFFLVGVSPGDVNEDGRVDLSDLTLVASSFGTETLQTSMTAPCSSTTGYSNAFYADMDGDGRVDVRDLTTVAGSFGQTY